MSFSFSFPHISMFWYHQTYIFSDLSSQLWLLPRARQCRAKQTSKVSWESSKSSLFNLAAFKKIWLRCHVLNFLLLPREPNYQPLYIWNIMQEETSEDRIEEVIERKNSAMKLGKGSCSLDAPWEVCKSSHHQAKLKAVPFSDDSLSFASYFIWLLLHLDENLRIILLWLKP